MSRTIVIFTDEEIEDLMDGREVNDEVNSTIYMSETTYRNSRLREKIELERDKKW